MPSIYVKPAPGGRVRMPERNSQVMPPEGAFVPRNDYYERLLIGGDVTETDPPKPATAAKPSKGNAPDKPPADSDAQ